jgi:hypothetical protein
MDRELTVINLKYLDSFYGLGGKVRTTPHSEMHKRHLTDILRGSNFLRDATVGDANQRRKSPHGSRPLRKTLNLPMLGRRMMRFINIKYL